MGILNVTPDSFFDGGRYLNEEAAIDHGLELVAQGADILDIGGESTRPGSLPVEETEELRRVIPVIEGLARQVAAPISIDTMKPAVARAAVAAGASIINDVGANRAEPEMWQIAAESGAAYVCMHMQGVPKTMQASPFYLDVVMDVARFFQERLLKLERCGVPASQIILDPGIGFGKTLEHNLQLLGNLWQFARFRRPLLIGVSRKSFIGHLAGSETANRLPGGLACACLGTAAGVHVVRVHDVAETVLALRMTEAILSKSKRAE